MVSGKPVLWNVRKSTQMNGTECLTCHISSHYLMKPASSWGERAHSFTSGVLSCGMYVLDSQSPGDSFWKHLTPVFQWGALMSGSLGRWGRCSAAALSALFCVWCLCVDGLRWLLVLVSPSCFISLYVNVVVMVQHITDSEAVCRLVFLLRLIWCCSCFYGTVQWECSVTWYS